MSLQPINTPNCPQCRSTACGRGGYVREKKGSLWKCRACGHEFVLRTLVLKSAVRS